MEGEDSTRPRVRIAFVAEVGLDAGGFVEERQLAAQVAAQEVREIFRIAAGLVGDGREMRSCFFGFDDADRFAINQQEVVAATFLQPDFTNCDSFARGEVELLVVLNDPTSAREDGINLLSGELFGGRHGKPAVLYELTGKRKSEGGLRG